MAEPFLYVGLNVENASNKKKMLKNVCKGIKNAKIEEICEFKVSIALNLINIM